VLSGLLDDGSSGLMVIRAAGGVAIVQDPEEATFLDMPENAAEHVPDAKVLPIRDIPGELTRLLNEELSEQVPVDNAAVSEAIKETRLAETKMSEIEDENRIGNPSSLACPDCGGVLWEIDQNGLLRYRCRVGHAFTAQHLDFEQRHAIESALWAALRALEESASLYRRMANRARNLRQSFSSATYEDRAEGKEAHAKTLRDFLMTVSSDNAIPAEANKTGNIAESA
jgi:two-component system chemotaxis response regulator CheB